MAGKYLFITEGGGQIFTVNDEPTSEDIKCLGVGILSIIRLSDMHFMSADGQWSPVGRGELVLHSDPELIEVGGVHFPVGMTS